MASTTTKPAPVFSDKVNSVKSVTDVRVVAARYTNADGAEHVGIFLVMGKDTEDNGVGVYSLLDGENINSLRIPSKHIKAGIRAYIASGKEVGESDVPESLANLDIGG